MKTDIRDGITFFDGGKVTEKAFILIKCETGEVNKVIDEVKKIENIQEAYAITGTHDIITFVETVNLPTLQDVIIEKLRKVDAVTGTSTAMVVSEWKRN